MKTPARVALPLSLAFLLAVRVSAAEPTCLPVQGFNELMEKDGTAAQSVTVRFDLTGVDLADYLDGKGWIADLADGTCATLASAALKVYGAQSVPNVAHPPGTIKFEHGSACCPAPPCTEHWAEPNPGPVVFTGPAQICNVELRLTPQNVGYTLVCGEQTFLGDSENTDQLRVSKVWLLSLAGGGQPMKNATATNDSVCFETAPKSASEQRLTVIEDAMGASATPTQVATPNTDLACGAGEGNIYLKIAVDNPLGTVTKATRRLRATADGSAAGDGADVFRVADNAWSEQTLTYANAPQTQGPSLGRIGPVVPGTWYSVDVTTTIKGKGVYGFALVPSAADQNGAHFSSKEAGATVAPYVQIEYAVVDADGDGAPNGPDCRDDDAKVHPGAAETCNGIDDDCDGMVDEGCPGAGGAGGGGGASGGGGDGVGPAGPGGASVGGGGGASGAVAAGGGVAKGGGSAGGLAASAGAAGAAGKRSRGAEEGEGAGEQSGCAVGALEGRGFVGSVLLSVLGLGAMRRRGRTVPPLSPSSPSGRRPSRK